MTWYLTTPTEANTGDFGNDKDPILFERDQKEREREREVLFTKHESIHSTSNSHWEVFIITIIVCFYM